MQSAAKSTEPTPVVGSWALAPEVQPDPKMALAFFAALFKPGDCLHFRAVAEPADGRVPSNHHYLMDEKFSETIADFLEYCFVEKRAAFFLPGAVVPGRTHKDAVISLPAVLADFDKGDPSASLAAAEAEFGPATVVVESGGQTEHGPKLHGYWAIPTEDQTNIEGVCRAREALALKYEADPAFKQQAQILRTPGSVHFKKGARLVQLKTLRPEVVRPLSTFPAAPHNTNVVNFLDFNNVSPPGATVEDLRTMYVETEGKSSVTRWEWFSRVAGAEIADVRAGRKTLEEAELYMRGAVQRNMEHPEDWDDARVAREFAALARLDVESRGPFIPVQPVTQETVPEGFSIAAWNISKLQGKVPERTWLVDGLIPAGTAGVFAAVGDAGKSMLALRLAYVVGCYPASQVDPIYDFGAPTFFGQPIVGRGATCVVTSEDDAAEVYRRVAALDASNLRSRHSKTYVVPMLATGGPRAILTDGASGPQATDFWRELRAQLLAVPDLKLVVLDPLSAFISGDTNDNSFGAALMTMLGSFAAESGAAVMLVHHMAKGTVPTDLTDARTSIRGAGALVDNSRWALAMWEADQDKAYSILKPLGQDARAKQAGIVYQGGLAKSNAPGTKTLRTLVRNAASGLLEDVTDQLAAVRPQQAEIDAAAFAALLAEAREDARFAFTAGEQGLWKSWHPVFTQAGVRVVRTEVEGLFHRLLSARKLVRTQQKRGSYPLYAVNVDQ